MTQPSTTLALSVLTEDVRTQLVTGAQAEIDKDPDAAATWDAKVREMQDQGASNPYEAAQVQYPDEFMQMSLIAYCEKVVARLTPPVESMSAPKITIPDLIITPEIRDAILAEVARQEGTAAPKEAPAGLMATESSPTTEGVTTANATTNLDHKQARERLAAIGNK